MTTFTSLFIVVILLCTICAARAVNDINNSPAQQPPNTGAAVNATLCFAEQVAAADRHRVGHAYRFGWCVCTQANGPWNCWVATYPVGPLEISQRSVIASEWNLDKIPPHAICGVNGETLVCADNRVLWYNHGYGWNNVTKIGLRDDEQPCSERNGRRLGTVSYGIHYSISVVSSPGYIVNPRLRWYHELYQSTFPQGYSASWQAERPIHTPHFLNSSQGWGHWEYKIGVIGSNYMAIDVAQTIAFEPSLQHLPLLVDMYIDEPRL